MVTRIGSFAQSQALLNELTRANQRVFDAQLEITTGKVAQQYKDMPRETGVLLAAKRVETRTSQYLRTTQELSGRLEHQNVILEQMSTAAGDLRQSVLDSVSLESGAAFNERLESIFRQAVSALNAKLDGRYVFGGARSDRPPVNVNSIADLIAAPTVDDVFDNDQQTMAAEVDNGQVLDYTFLASDIGRDLMDAIKRIATYNAGPQGPFGETLTQTQRAYLESELGSLKTMTEDLNRVVARNGQLQNEVDGARDRHEQTSVFVKGFISDIEDVDLAAAVTRLNQSQLATEASAKVLADLRKLSLLDYI